jgi:hypothetical protein
MGIGADNDGDEMWRTFISQHPNIFLVLNGHTHGWGRRADIGVHGNLVNQVLADYQSETRGGNGYLRILRFRPWLNQIAVSTYSPYVNQWRTDSGNQFTLTYKSSGTATLGGSGSVEGTVRASNCSPLAGARVANSEGATTTDSAGRYVLRVSSPRSHSVTASPSGMSASTQQAFVFTGYGTLTDFHMGTASSAAPCALSSVSPSVTICTPANGALVGSPVRIVAGTTSNSAPVTAMKIYVDGAEKYFTQSRSLDASLSLASGTRTIEVKAWNSTGTSFKSVVKVQVGTSSGTSCSASNSMPTINICSPGDGATVGSPARLIAAAGSPNPVRLMQVYVDGVKKYEVGSNRIDVSLPMALGLRRLTVQGLDTAGSWFKRSIYVTVR